MKSIPACAPTPPKQPLRLRRPGETSAGRPTSLFRKEEGFFPHLIKGDYVSAVAFLSADLSTKALTLVEVLTKAGAKEKGEFSALLPFDLKF